MAQRRTDLAQEARQIWQESARKGERLPGVETREGSREGFQTSTVAVTSPEGAKALGKPMGTYVTVELEGLFRREKDAFQRAARAVAAELEALLPPEGTALVVGLGNRAVTPDLIGPLAVDRMLATRHLVEQIPDHFGHLRPVAAISPGVLASTGVESGEVAAALAGELHPSCVIAIDALASRSLERLCRTVQLSDAGIVPGSGVGNHRFALDRETLGTPVFAVGAPTVVDGATLVLDLLGDGAQERDELKDAQRFFVTPREVDSRVADMAKVIGYGVSLALNPSLTVEDLTMLLE